MRNAGRFLLLAGLLLVGIAAHPANAALKWESTTIERELPAGADVVEVHFAFSNPEKHPVTIIHLQPSCGCTTALVKKQTFAPGETGELTALFNGTGLSGGVQEKTIQVDLDDESKPVTLTLRITVPTWIEVSPRVLSWTLGEAPKAKEVLITLNQQANVKIASLKVDNPTVSVSLRPADGPGKYRLIAKPASTATALQVAINLTLEIPGTTPRNYPVFAQVR